MIKQNVQYELQEDLRQAAALGNLEKVTKLVKQGVDMNGQNKMNGWTALHWAVHRGNNDVVSFLMVNGADKTLKNQRGETASALVKSEKTAKILGEPSVPEDQGSGNASFTPNYVRHPEFFYGPDGPERNEAAVNRENPPVRKKSVTIDESCNTAEVPTQDAAAASTNSSGSVAEGSSTQGPLVLKVRLGNCEDDDFFEMEVGERTYHGLVTACSEELEIQPSTVWRIRKLPNVIIRKDRDVERLQENQEVEVILKD
eukprot:Clim_evm34s172 gene=Clim_evmTU34s172